MIATPQRVSAESAAVKPLALGVYADGVPEDVHLLDRYAALIGIMPAIVMWYQTWAGPGDHLFNRASMSAVVQRGATPMVTWEPWDPYAGIDQPNFALWTIIAGHHDEYIYAWARSAREWGESLYVRFGHEMNGTWYTWSAEANGNTAAEYVAAWQYIHGIFTRVGATNVRWVWSPNAVSMNVKFTPLEQLYPGDQYVDVIGIDGYNFGTTEPSGWRTLVAIFGATYERIRRLTQAKPMIIAETASTELGGDKAAWIRDAFLHELLTYFPHIRAVIWFHKDKETDWRIDSSNSALAAYRDVVKSPRYGGRGAELARYGGYIQ